MVDRQHSGTIIKWSIIFNLFLLSVVIRLWDINVAGRTWDEFAYVSSGNELVELAKNFDFTNDKWHEIADHPPVARYFYGLASYFDVNFVRSGGAEFLYKYSWTAQRIVSVLFSSLTVIFIVLLGWKERSPFTGVIAGVIFITLPVFVGLSHLVTLESPLIFFFTATVYSFIQFLKKRTLLLASITGVLLGLAVGVKLTNVLLFPVLTTSLAVWCSGNRKKGEIKKMFLYLLGIFVLAFIVFVASWPGLWTNPTEIINTTISQRFSGGRISELFLGQDVTVPYYYFFLYLVVTTPIIVMFFFIWGVKIVLYERKKFGVVLIIWFLLPFIQSLYGVSVNGIRYIIEIYAPLSLIAAMGFDGFTKRVAKTFRVKAILLFVFALYLLITLVKISPYYLSYFNHIFGGAKGVYAAKLFPLGWWGEGQSEAADYISQYKLQHSKIGLAVIPKYVFPGIPSSSSEYIENKEELEERVNQKKYDFIVINYLYLIRTKSDEELLYEDYFLVYSVIADGAPIVKVFMRK